MSPFALLRRNPSIFPAELCWRWSFGLGAIAVLLVIVRRVMESLKLAGLFDITFVHADPMERLQMTAEALVRVIPMVAPVALWAAVALTALWIVSATIGRGVVVRAIVRLTAPEAARAERFSWVPMAGVHFARVFTLIILLIGYLLAAVAEQAIMRRNLPPDAAPGTLPDAPAMLGMAAAFLVVFGVSLVVWSVTHFVVSLAPIFVARDGRKTLDAIEDSINVSRRHWRDFASEATQNATLRTVVAFAITAVAIVAGLLVRTAPILAWTLVALLTFGYIVVSDWLLLARTVAYARIIETESRYVPSAQLDTPILPSGVVWGKRVRADFNGLFGSILCLSHSDTATDEEGSAVVLSPGMAITAFDEDFDEHGNRDDLIASGIVEPSPKPLRCRGSRWILRIDERGARHESDDKEPQS